MAQEKKKQEPIDNGISTEKAQELIDKLNEMISQYGMEAKIFKKDYIESLDSREASLKEHEANLAAQETENKKRLAEAVTKETAAKLRIDEMTAKEAAFEAIRADLEKQANDVAAKKAEIFATSEKLASELYDKRIQETEEEVQRIRDAAFEEAQKIRDAALADAQKTREAAETAAESTRADAQKKLESVLASADQQVKTILDNAKANAKLLVDEATSQASAVRQSAHNDATQIVATANKQAETIRNEASTGIATLNSQIEDLKSTNANLAGENAKLSAANEALVKEKENLDGLVKAKTDELVGKTAEYETNLAEFRELRAQLANSGRDVAQFSEDISNLVTREQELNGKESELNDLKRTLSLKEKRNERKDESLREMQEDIDGEVKKRYGEIIESKDSKITILEGELNDLRNTLETNMNIVNKFDDLTREFGENPVEVLAKVTTLEAQLSVALDTVNNTPSYVLQKKAKDLEEFKDTLEERAKSLDEKIAENERLRTDATLKQDTIDSLNAELENKDKDIMRMTEQLNRLRSTYENPAAEEDRIKEINKPYVVNKDDMVRSDKKFEEIEWLDGIGKKIDKFGLHFPRRILHAFHTALKTSEMAPITVLAGVSGTGKSELPRLYSYFGGINFLPVPVQPNWDSQESMLGYYNSIDNCFEPHNILRLLAQSQRKADDQDGLDDVMTMILLDEMNLANIELYFAEFLSKLETRRGLNDTAVPKLPVKIGSKMKDWELPLGRNVLWTGTMNNDETTKALSDKVLDRGIVINFPRPDTLFRSKNNRLQGKAPLLSRTNWEAWKKEAYQFKKDEIESYRNKVQEINKQLGQTGRAIGHRVWQSIESYMSFYPDVISATNEKDRLKAMDTAFEDQIVQKVMPKLRGLEIRGEQGKALDAIGGLIPETLREDFANAKQGYGQFIWTTSGYLLQGDKAPEEQDEGQTEQQSEQLPEDQTKEKKANGKKK